MEKLKDSHGVDVQWHSYELRPAGTTISPEYREKILSYRPAFAARAKADYDIEINYGPFGIDSRPALIGAKFADAQGAGEAFHDAVMHAYWQDALDISDVGVLSGCAQSAGLDEAAFVAALDDAQWDSEVTADVEQAFAFGLQGVPALILHNKYLVSGAQPYEVLVRAVEQIAAEEGIDAG